MWRHLLSDSFQKTPQSSLSGGCNPVTKDCCRWTFLSLPWNFTIEPNCEKKNRDSKLRLTGLSVHSDGLSTRQFWERLFLDFSTGPHLFFTSRTFTLAPTFTVQATFYKYIATSDSDYWDGLHLKRRWSSRLTSLRHRPVGKGGRPSPGWPSPVQTSVLLSPCIKTSLLSPSSPSRGGTAGRWCLSYLIGAMRRMRWPWWSRCCVSMKCHTLCAGGGARLDSDHQGGGKLAWPRGALLPHLHVRPLPLPCLCCRPWCKRAALPPR